ncbi:MAG: hypothetical protein K1X82_07190 [Bacteroidia bacterium]|nr:hypothetical protein [Bacteroidia bacterium]
MFSLQGLTQKFINFHKLGCVCPMGDSNLDLAIFQSVYDLPFDHWNSVIGEEKLLLTIPYLAAVEAMPTQNMAFHYCIVYHQTLPVGVFYFQEFDFSLADMNANVETSQLNNTLNLFDKLKNTVSAGFKNIQLRLLVAGNCYISGDYGFCFVNGFPNDNFSLVLDTAIQKIMQSKKDGKKIQGILVKDFSENQEVLVAGLKEKNYFPFHVDPNMVLQIPEGIKTMEEFVALFSSKYRVRVRSCEKKFKGVESRYFGLEDLVKHYDQIKRLYLNVEEKAGFNLLKVPENYFIELKKNLEDAFLFRAYFIENKLVGFSSSFVWSKKVEAHFVGLDYEYNQTYGLYQNMLYDFLKQALDAGSNWLYLGRTALEIKSTLGAVPDQMTLLAKSPNALFNRLVPPIFSNLKQTEWIQRRPFKDGEEA